MGRFLRPGYKIIAVGTHTNLKSLIAANIIG